MNIQLKSDLHWEQTAHQTVILTSAEKDDSYVSSKADILVLAGDIVNANEYQINYMIHKFKNVKIPILYVPGNHEYWGTSVNKGKALLKEKLKDTNITLLDKDWKIIKDKDGEEILFIGATLWTNLSDPLKAIAGQGSRDFKNIKEMTINDWTNRYADEKYFIDDVMSYINFYYMKRVIITHYLPGMQSVPDRFKGDPMNCIFVAEVEDLINHHKPELYIHGHTHDSNDYMLGETRVVSNPKGRQYYDYNGLNPNYNNELIIEI